jgi:hypothetical protein
MEVFSLSHGPDMEANKLKKDVLNRLIQQGSLD